MQEFSLKKFKKLPIYKLLSNTGPRHKPLFKVAVKLVNTRFYSAEGKSKKDAEQNAAVLCLQNINSICVGRSRILLSKNRYNENSLIAEVYTKIMGNLWYNIWWNFKKNKKLSSNWKPDTCEF